MLFSRTSGKFTTGVGLHSPRRSGGLVYLFYICRTMNQPMKTSKKPVRQKKGVPSGQKPGKISEQGFLIKNKELILLAVVIVVTFAIYFPALQHKFTNWDDQQYVTENQYIKALTPANLERIFTRPMAVNYHPLTMLSLALNYRFSGLEPWPYFLVNIILHLFNTVLTFYFAFLVLGRNKPLALFVAAIFAVHPMHVESVAWISERKDVLYSFFYLSGMISWIYFIGKRRWPWYLFSLLLFVLAGLSKPSSVVFPLMLLLIDYLYKRKFNLVLVAEKIPFFAISAGIGIATIYAQIDSAVADFSNYTVIQRFLFGSFGFFIYIFKLVIPYGLSTLHPFPLLDNSLNLPWVYFMAPVINLVIVALVIYSMKQTRMLFFCLTFYFLNILLTLQFMQVGGAVISERYTYISYIGLLAGAGWMMNRATERYRIPAGYFYAVMILFFCVMAFLAARRVTVWQDSETLWSDVIAKYPENSTSYNSRGYFYLKEKKLDKALPDFNKALELRPSYLDALNNRGSVYRLQNLPRLAIIDYNRALSVDPDFFNALSGRGNAYFTLGILDSALTDFNRALEINPAMAIALGNRGAVYFRMGQYDRAVQDCSRAIEIDPYYTEAYMNRGVAYSMLRQWDQAISDYTFVLGTDPENHSVLEWRGIANRSKGAFGQAITDFSDAIRLNPSKVSLYINRSLAFKQAGLHQKAVDDINKARQLGANVTEQSVFSALK